MRTSEETEVMQAIGVPAQETEEVSTALATEIIADLKKQLEEAKEEAKDWEESWNVCREQVRVLSRQSDIISMALRMDDVELLDLALDLLEDAITSRLKRNRRQKTMEKCNLTQVPCRKAIMDVVQANKDRRSLQHIYELAELFRIACSSNEAFMELSEEDQERFWLIIDALMMNDLEDLKRVHNLANYLMVKRIKDNVKVAEA